MPPFMQAFHAQAYALLRIVAEFLFLSHGASKLFEFPMPPPEIPPMVTYVAGPIELVCGFLVMVGLFAGWAAFPCSVLMALAYWIVHGTWALFPIVNNGEMAALFCFVFLFISSQGSGIWSVDHVRKKPRPCVSICDGQRSREPYVASSARGGLCPDRAAPCAGSIGQVLVSYKQLVGRRPG